MFRSKWAKIVLTEPLVFQQLCDRRMSTGDVDFGVVAVESVATLRRFQLLPWNRSHHGLLEENQCIHSGEIS